MKILQPYYYDEFKCVGDKCRNTCCEGWNIWIDKESFKKYKNEDDEFGKYLNSKMEINDQSEDDTDYGEFMLDIEGRCSLLNEKNLCKLYINKGEEYLCRTCTVFPRTADQFTEDYVERNLELSCPVVAGYLVENNISLEFVVKEDELTDLDEKIITEWYDGIKERDDLYLKSRNMLIKTAKAKEISIEKRLIFMKMIQSKIQSVLDEEEYLKGFDILKEAEDAIKSNLNIVDFKIEENKNTLQKYNMILNILNLILEEEFYMNEKLSDFIRILVEFITDRCNFKKEYLERKEREFSSYFNDKEYILENYIVYDIYKRYMASIEDVDTDKVLNILIISYSIMKAMLISIWDTNKDLNDNDIIDVLSLYEKYIQESFVRDSIEEFLNEVEYDTLEKLKIMIL